MKDSMGTGVIAVMAVGLVLALLSFVIARAVLWHRTRKLCSQREEYRRITEQALHTIANAVDVRDEYTNGHSVRVAGYSRELARRMHLSDSKQENIYYAALLHDIGKIGISGAVLNKQSTLTPEEFAIMKEHPVLAAAILRDFTALPNVREGALTHHEDYGGGGYPSGTLSGEAIPLVGRIIRVADAYDAMSSKRAYRGAQTVDYILSEFETYRGIQFDPSITDLMLGMIRDGFRPSCS
ncbi:MAG: HD-GYP domain-containing protein [Angelakisella sp.]